MKTFAKIAATLFVALAAPASQAGVIWASNGHEYEVVNSEGVKWTDAASAVAALGGGWHLATVTSPAEQTFVSSLLSTALANRSHFWLGASDTATEGSFAWVTGEAFSYTNWAGGEPNNSGDEDFLALDLRSGTWFWNDAPDNLGAIFGFARGYVMERPVREPSKVPEPAGLALAGLALAGLAGLRRRRR
jgi:hypothetical protein